MLVAPLAYPWRERAKPLGGRGWHLMLVVVCFVLLCFVLDCFFSKPICRNLI